MSSQPTLFPTDATVRAGACISLCGRYRYWLTRTWSDAPSVCWIGLNPSTADAANDDPTIRRMCGFARAWGAGGIVVVNLFAYRATYPADMYVIAATNPGKPVCVIGPGNDEHILACAAGKRIVAAWGCDGSLLGRDRAVMDLLRGQSVECLGTTKDGNPRHPLYIAGDTVHRPFVMPEARHV
jgi:hypothetical protein